MKLQYKEISKILLKTPAHAVFILIIIGLGLNSIFNSISVALGAEFPRNTFLYISTDLFADFFKWIFSYPHSFPLKIDESSILLNSYINQNPYNGISGLANGTLTHFHSPPLSTTISLAYLNLMNFIDPRMLYLASILIMFVTVYFFFKKYVVCKTDKSLLFLSFLLSYPTLFFITRGNIFAGIVALSLIAYLVLLHRKEHFYIAILLLAIAVNLRPNAIIFIFALLIADRSKIIGLICFICLSTLIFFSSLSISNILYPEYTFRHFLDGLKTYHSIYVIGNGGVAYGSSLFGAFKMMFGYVRYLEPIISLIGISVVLYASYRLIKNYLSDTAYIFILCAIYALCSSVFADYHLMVFFAPIIFLYLDNNKTPYQPTGFLARRKFEVIFFSCIFQLIPKNYYFLNEISFQVILNPLVLVFAVASLLVKFNYLTLYRKSSHSKIE